MQRLYRQADAHCSKVKEECSDSSAAVETKRTLTAEIERIKTKNDRISALEAEARLHEETNMQCHDTLVNHKRDAYEHKVQSSVLQQDLAALIEQKEEIEKQRMQCSKETARWWVS